MKSGDDTNWLPEDYVLHLTALEAGAMMSCLQVSKQAFPNLNLFEVNVRGRDKPMPMVDRLIEKLDEERKRHL